MATLSSATTTNRDMQKNSGSSSSLHERGALAHLEDSGTTPKWTKEEDGILLRGRPGREWHSVATLIPGKTASQCKERWETQVTNQSQIVKDNVRFVATQQQQRQPKQSICSSSATTEATITRDRKDNDVVSASPCSTSSSTVTSASNDDDNNNSNEMLRVGIPAHHNKLSSSSKTIAVGTKKSDHQEISNESDDFSPRPRTGSFHRRTKDSQNVLMEITANDPNHINDVIPKELLEQMTPTGKTRRVTTTTITTNNEKGAARTTDITTNEDDEDDDASRQENTNPTAVVVADAESVANDRSLKVDNNNNNNNNNTKQQPPHRPSRSRAAVAERQRERELERERERRELAELFDQRPLTKEEQRMIRRAYALGFARAVKGGPRRGGGGRAARFPERYAVVPDAAKRPRCLDGTVLQWNFYAPEPRDRLAVELFSLFAAGNPHALDHDLSLRSSGCWNFCLRPPPDDDDDESDDDVGAEEHKCEPAPLSS